MQADQNSYNYPQIPYNQQGFTVSFNLDNFNPKQVTQFYHTYGFVVFDDIVTQNEAQKTIDQLWADLQLICGKQPDRHDKNTWNFKKWRGKFGFVNHKPLYTRQICLNRQNPKVYKAFKTMYELSSGRPLLQALIASFDRGSAMRPAGIDKQWITNPIYHFDINPWWWTQVVPNYPKNWKNISDYQPAKFENWKGEGNFLPYQGYTKLAGVLALSTTNQTSGGFQCVPGFQNVISEWCKRTPYNTQIKDDPELMKNFQKILMKKGSLLVFTRELPHNIYPNLSQNFRFAQYLRMSPQSSLMLTEFEKEKRKQCIKHILPKDLPVDDPISKEVYMLD